MLKIKTKDPSEENVSMFKKCRNRVIALQRKAEMDYQKEQLSLNLHDLRKSWKVSRQILGLKQEKKIAQILSLSYKAMSYLTQTKLQSTLITIL